MEFLLVLSEYRTSLFQKASIDFKFLDMLLDNRWIHEDNDYLSLPYSTRNGEIKKYYFAASSPKEARKKALVYLTMSGE